MWTTKVNFRVGVTTDLVHKTLKRFSFYLLDSVNPTLMNLKVCVVILICSVGFDAKQGKAKDAKK